MSHEHGSQQLPWVSPTSSVCRLFLLVYFFLFLILTRSRFCIGGLLPMIPYFAMKNTNHALFISIGITVVICITFGFLKNYAILKTKRAGLYGAAQTLIVGALAAGTSYGIVYGVDHSNIGA